jgi:hypothetical protein
MHQASSGITGRLSQIARGVRIDAASKFSLSLRPIHSSVSGRIDDDIGGVLADSRGNCVLVRDIEVPM